MKCIFNFLFYIFSLNICFSASYESNSINTVKSTKVINLPDGSSYSTLEVDGSGSNNLGIYEIIYCAGHRISKNSKLIQQDFYCNVELSNNDYYTFLMKRSETDTDAGVGYIVIAGGSKPFEQRQQYYRSSGARHREKNRRAVDSGNAGSTKRLA